MASLLLLAGAAPAQEATEVPLFKAGASEVRVDVQVLQKDLLVEGLTAADFRVLDNGELRPLVAFDREQEPLSLLLLLDVSGSMSKFLAQLNAVSDVALRQLKEGDSVGVMLFSRHARLHSPFTTDRAAVVAALKEAGPQRGLGSGTVINPALLEAAKVIRESAPSKGRRAIVIVTDNLSLNYQSPDEAVIRELHSVNTVLNAIVVGRGRRPDDGPKSKFLNPDFTPANVFRIAEETGGDAVKADRADEVFPGMIERIRTRYGLTYASPGGNPGEFREIRVELTPTAAARYPGARLRSRKGYYVQ